MSLPSRASDHLERTGGQSAGDELRRNGRVPDLRRYGAGQRSGRGGGARRRQVSRKGAAQFERSGVKGAEVEADGGGEAEQVRPPDESAQRRSRGTLRAERPPLPIKGNSPGSRSGNQGCSLFIQLKPDLRLFPFR